MLKAKNHEAEKLLSYTARVIFLYLSRARVKLRISPELLNQIGWNLNQWCVRLDTTDLYKNFIKICWKLFILLTIEIFGHFFEKS